jgi:hypothetical protein
MGKTMDKEATIRMVAQNAVITVLTVLFVLSTGSALRYVGVTSAPDFIYNGKGTTDWLTSE